MTTQELDKAASAEPLLEVRDLVTRFRVDEQWLCAVDGVSFSVDAGTTVGLVGESGCGKSVTSLSIMRLIPVPPGEISQGVVKFRGRDLLHLPERDMRSLRGNDVSMIFQEPMTSLNPVQRVGPQIVEALRAHRSLSRAQARERATEMLRLVGIPDPTERFEAFPHELSGGMRQRVMIAIALVCEPRLLIADEPTTALDVTVQAQILELLKRLQKSLNMSVILITHDLAVVAEFAEHTIVMYAGKVVERAATADLFREPLHPYTQGLIASLPNPHGDDGVGDPDRPHRLPTIAGVVPPLSALPPGCRFQDRCPHAMDRCRQEEPALRPVQAAASARSVACFLVEPEGAASP